MKSIFQEIIDWSEVWALLIPITAALLTRTPGYLKPVKVFLFIALFFNIGINMIWKFKDDWSIQPGNFFFSNNFIYNAESIVRLLLFSWFFILLKQRFMHRVKAVLPFLFMAFVIVNFIFIEDFFAQSSFSSRLLATEAGLLLFYCLQYFIYLMVEDKTNQLTRNRGFWLVTGLLVYVAVNFFIFLFYASLSKESSEEKIRFAEKLWDVHNYVFILFCIFMSIEFSRKNVQ